ncbi:MAG: hypothetical protein KJO77_08185 [Bacteroidia bacterium]|nr:hypothetical protein [Bacteroidia bacterium]NND51449.1 hypothetical protein [Flavobacteriaceae bacterium]
MIRQSILVIFALFALNVNANTEKNENPFTDFISFEIEKFELEQELFGETTNDEAVSIASLDVYEIEEDLELGFNTSDYLPSDFDARKGMKDIDWNTIELYEIEDDYEIGFDTKAYLPKGFNPYKGMKNTEAAEVTTLIKIK